MNGRIIITNRPKRKNGKPSARLLAQRERFKEAAAYATAAAADEAARAMYAKRVRGKHESPYSVALGDFLNPPTVKLIDVSLYHGAVNDIVQIDASDDFMVTKVTVTITDARGVVIEQGNATEHPTRVSRWEYKAVSANRTLKGTKIIAIAHDRPGNRGKAEVVL